MNRLWCRSDIDFINLGGLIEAGNFVMRCFHLWVSGDNYFGFALIFDFGQSSSLFIEKI